MEPNGVSIETKRDSDRVNQVLLPQVLTMAQGYRAAGDVRAAMDLYWLLAEEHQETRQAAMAREALLDMAASYERRRAPHMARSIYERFLTH
jgi:phage tail tube protein FII